MVEFQLPKLTTRVRFPSPARINGRSSKFIFWISVLMCSVSLITGCSTTQKKEPLPPVPVPVVEKPKGVYHKVAKQESLWRIAKTYGVSLDEIVKANNIPNAAIIEENQLVFVPGAVEMLKVVLDKPDGKPDEFAWPLKGRVISYFHDAQGQSVNRGIDIASVQGEEIRAVRDGKVVFADYLGGYGYAVIMDHLDGFYSVYARQSNVSVKSGETISKGTPLGRLAKSGRLAFLHFEIRKMEEPNNPLYYLP